MRLHPAVEVEPWVGPLSPPEIVQRRKERDREAPTLTGEPVAVASVEDRRIGGVDVRMYVPERDRPTAVTGALVWLHGGGWVFGSLDTADGACRRLADRSGLAVVSVDYRLSPEHTWPAATDDGEVVLEALAGGADEVADLAIDPARIVVAGDSAGGFLTAVLARRARDDGRDVAGQVLVYPVVRRAALDDLADEVGATDGLSAAAMRWYWDSFLGPDPQPPADPADLDPLAADLVDLPPALVVTAEHDILRAEGEEYAQALQDAGVDVVTAVFGGMPHGFFRDLATLRAACTAVDLVANWSGELAA